MMYYYRATIVRWVDGDTVDLDIDLGMNVRVHERIRLLGVDTPETNRKASRSEGLNSNARVDEPAPPGTIRYIRTHQDGKGKYGRYLATVYCEDGLESIGEVLIREGLAKVYGT